MRPSVFRGLLSVALLAASSCKEETMTVEDAGGEDVRPSPDGGDREDVGPELRPCDPALDLDDEATVLLHDLYTVTATGGTGAYRFTIAQNGSGALINELTGAYLSGDDGGTDDV